MRFVWPQRIVAGCAATATPRVDESQLLSLGFKVLVATTTVQQEWVKGLTPGQIRPMQRNGKHFFIYPDASRNQTMRKATARDLSDPFLGPGWADLGW